MQTRVFFVRHAQPDLSVKDDLLRPLTEKGKRDAEKVTKTLRGQNIDVIYSSPLKRAYDTVKDLAQEIGVAINPVDDFRERKIDNVWVNDFREFSRRQWDDFNFKLEHGECLNEVQKRNIEALYEVIETNRGLNIVIATHGTALATIINYFNHDFGYDDFWLMIDKMPYILCFTFDEMELAGMEEWKLVIE